MTSTSTVIDSRYRLGRLLGRGAMSDVYYAVDERSAGPVAIKIVRSEDPSLAVRMAREARALESLDHPNLIRLLDAGLIKDRAYLVMTFVEGVTLATRLQQGQLTPHETATVGTAVAGALAYIHDRGIVHRDIKPANILMGADGQVRLGDFGVARLADASALTVTGTTLGTVAYMAPEQLESHQVGPSADVWSLGIVLLECLTGTRAYAGSPSEVLARRLAGPVVLPATLPDPWTPILAEMLARSPEVRPDAAVVKARLGTLALETSSDSWGPPVGDEVPPTQLLRASDAVPPPPTDVYLSRAAPPPGRSAPWRRWAALAGAVAAAALLLALWAAGPGSKTQAPARATTSLGSTTSRPNTTVPPPPTAASALAALSRDVAAGVTAGTVAADAGTAVNNAAAQAVTDAAGGNPSHAANDLQRAATGIVSGVRDGSVRPSTAPVLQRDLVLLATTLGLPGASTPPSTVAPAPGHKHGDGARKGD